MTREYRCGAPAPVRAGPGRPRVLRGRCRGRRGRPVAVPDWSGPVSRAVATELPGAADVWVVLVRFVAAYVDGCQDAPGLVALSRGLRRTLAVAREHASGRGGDGDELSRIRRARRRPPS